MKRLSWTADERARALAAFESGGLPALQSIYPDFSADSLRCRIRSAKNWRWAKRGWTEAQHDTLRTMWMRGDSINSISLALNRSRSSIEQKRQALKLPARDKRPWTSGQLRILADEADALIGRLVMRFGHPRGSVQNKVVKALMQSRKRRRASALEVA